MSCISSIWIMIEMYHKSSYLHWHPMLILSTRQTTPIANTCLANRVRHGDASQMRPLDWLSWFGPMHVKVVHQSSHCKSTIVVIAQHAQPIAYFSAPSFASKSSVESKKQAAISFLSFFLSLFLQLIWFDCSSYQPHHSQRTVTHVLFSFLLHALWEFLFRLERQEEVSLPSLTFS